MVVSVLLNVDLSKVLLCKTLLENPLILFTVIIFIFLYIYIKYTEQSTYSHAVTTGPNSISLVSSSFLKAKCPAHFSSFLSHRTYTQLLYLSDITPRNVKKQNNLMPFTYMVFLQ